VKKRSLGRRHNYSVDRVIVGTTLVDNIWENTDRGKEIYEKVGFPYSKNIRLI